jgi:hypothetical protein
MALIATLGEILIGTLTKILSSIAGDEIKAWGPAIVRYLTKFAVYSLPESQRQRFAEEWQSHLEEVPGLIGKLWVASGLSLAAFRIALSSWRNRYFEDWAAIVAEVNEVKTAMVTITAIVRNDSSATPEVLDRMSIAYREAQELSDLVELHFAKAVANRTFLFDLYCMFIGRTNSRATRKQVCEKAKIVKDMCKLIVTQAEAKANEHTKPPVSLSQRP